MQKILLRGKPYALKRHRMTKKGRSYDPNENIRFAREARKQFLAQRITPTEGPIFVSITAVFDLPKYRHRVREPVSVRTYHFGRPDLDNIVKAIFDAGNGFLWKDDSQIVGLYANKMYGIQGERAFTEIEFDYQEMMTISTSPSERQHPQKFDLTVPLS